MNNNIFMAFGKAVESKESTGIKRYVGIAPVKVDDYKGKKGAVSIVDDDSDKAPVCDRRLRASFLKIREGAGTNTACEFYQCPTLKFFPEQVNYKNRLDIIKRKGLLEAYNLGNR